MRKSKKKQNKKKEPPRLPSNIALDIPMLEQRHLINLAIDGYNDWIIDNGYKNLAPMILEDNQFNRKISINYLCRQIRDQEQMLIDQYGWNFFHDIKINSFRAIARLYPWLAPECYKKIIKQKEISRLPKKHKSLSV